MAAPSKTNAEMKAAAAADGPCSESAPCEALLDSGDSFIELPAKLFGTLQGDLENACATPGCLQRAMEKESCDEVDLTTLPSLHLDLGGMQVAIPPHAYMIDHALKEPMTIRPAGNGTRCLPNIIESPRENLAILGMPFLRLYAARFESAGGVAVAAIPVGSKACVGASACSASG